jgi:hypothetical protein
MNQGKTIFECQNLNTLEIVYAAVTSQPQGISLLNPQVPADLGKIIDMMLAKNKEDRVQVSSTFQLRLLVP